MREFPTVVNNVFYFTGDMSMLFDDRKSALEYRYGPIGSKDEEERNSMIQPREACLLSYQNGEEHFPCPSNNVKPTFVCTNVVAHYITDDGNRFFPSVFDVEKYAQKNGGGDYTLKPVVKLESMVRHTG